MMSKRSLAANFNNQQPSNQNSPQGAVIPSVIQKTKNGERFWDLYSALLEKGRIIWLTNQVASENCELIKAELAYLSDQDPDEPIMIYIDSPGGSVDAGLSVKDFMHHIPNPVATVVAGSAMSMGSIISACGTEGMRYSLPNGHIMVHGPSMSDHGGKAEHFEEAAISMAKCRDRLKVMYATVTGLDDTNPEDLELVDRLLEDDNFMNPYIARECGLLDGILEPQGMTPAKQRLFDAEMRINKKEFDELPTNPRKLGSVIREYAAKVSEYRALAADGTRPNPWIAKAQPMPKTAGIMPSLGVPT